MASGGFDASKDELGKTDKTKNNLEEDLIKNLSPSLCTICFCTKDEDVFMKMPCCFAKDSSMQYCKSCLKKICSTAALKGIGHCPTCRRKFMFDPATDSITLNVPKGKCSMCLNCEIEDKNLCSACLIGRDHSYSYECDRCHKVQRIPHPMWRYQAKPDSFGTASWACHQDCKDYTFWKILESDLKNIPIDDCPESWGARKAWLSEIGKLVRQERAENSL